MARLYGHAVAMVGDRTDHTYVTSSERHVWPCAGRSTTGLHEEGTRFLSPSEPPGGTLTSVPTRLNRMIDEHLGDDYASDKRAHLCQLAAVAEHEQAELVSAFQSERITPDQYLERFTRLAGDLFASYERVLGRDDFVRLFGVAPEHALDFLDPELFRHAHGSRN